MINVEDLKTCFHGNWPTPQFYESELRRHPFKFDWGRTKCMIIMHFLHKICDLMYHLWTI